jgi:pimeloyl-ACP methyl ester carboxylesterase
MILVHGSMDTAASFRDVAARLDGFAVTRYDRRGYGSALAAGPASLAGHAGDLIDVFDGRPAFLAGHSLGGTIALAAAAKAPELVRGVLVYEPPMPWLPWWPEVRLDGPDGPRGAAVEFLRGHMGDERWARLPQEKRDTFLGFAPAWAQELRTAARDPAPFDPARLRVPLVAAYGTASDERHVRAAMTLADSVPGARLGPIEAANHLAHRLRPAEFAGLIRWAATERTDHGR